MKHLLAVLFCSCLALSGAAGVVVADLTKPDSGWRAIHHVKDAATTPAGLAFTVTDEDPWLVGPATPLPAVPAAAKRAVFTVTCSPTPVADDWQLFYAFGTSPHAESDSVRLAPVGQPPFTRFSAEVPLSALKAGPCRFRLDPPGRTATAFTVKTLEMDFMTPLWTYRPTPPPALDIPAATPLVVRGPDWELRHDPNRFGAFRFLSRGKTIENAAAEPIVYLDRDRAVRTLDCSAARPSARLLPNDGGLETSVQLKDADGRAWRIERRFTPTAGRTGLAIQTTFTASPLTDSDPGAEALHLPALTLFFDRASRGHKHQATLAGVEYLADEPSSSQKEIRTPEHNRLIPAAYRLSAPFAVFTDPANWFAATWDRTDAPFATVFDTPDRLFGSGGHLLAFWAPAVGPCRRESELDVYQPLAFRRLTQSVTLRTGAGGTVADALEVLVTPAALPPPDAVAPDVTLALLARGWLDSTIRSNNLVRHAIGASFAYHPAGDAPVLMRYLAAQLARRPGADAAALAARLRSTSSAMLATLRPHDIAHATVSHIHHPSPVLVAGDVAAFLDRKAADLKSINRQLAAGVRIWKAPAKGPDFGETLDADNCNGFTSMSLKALLENAVWSGDEAEIARALAVLDKVTARYHGTVPCGAQPWEMPLHTPDILASANLARAYTLGYLLSSRPDLLREARHWAYTGLAMVYLAPQPDPSAVGRYATCAVMGATHWSAPNWIGRPVQWCGLVYATALWDLARAEPAPAAAAYWRTIATGITTSGVRQTHTADDPEAIGCLPDSWNLTRQTRYAVPINPGTVQENYAECLDRPYYALRRLGAGSLLHLPGGAEALPARDGALRCRVAGWPEAPFKAVLTRVAPPRTVTLNGQPVEWTHVAAHRALVVTLPARATGELAVTF